MNDVLRVGLAQIEPVWLWREKTLQRVVEHVAKAGAEGCHLVVFGEALVPGYPFWVEHTNGASFESSIQKEFYAHYLDQAVQIEAGDLDGVCEVARDNATAVYLGVIERPVDRGGHSAYASLVYIAPDGHIGSVHRKLMPTYEERLVWATGDGHGLRVHPLNGFHVGGLNCWENWMPLARSALYAQGENVHVAVWPGSQRNTQDITRFIARESRSYTVSVSGLMSQSALDPALPSYELLKDQLPAESANGGSCVAGPDGQWVLEPQSGSGVFVADLALAAIRRERHSFDPVGHYARPDVLELSLNRRRQGGVDADE